jgi:uncharacterized protein involved in cysteine biosynthesis
VLLASSNPNGKLAGWMGECRMCSVWGECFRRDTVMIPEGFREFLGVEAGEEVTLVGAAVCVEIWHPQRWIEHLNETIPEFGDLLDELSS